MEVLAISKETVLPLVLVSIVAYLFQKFVRDTYFRNLPPGPIGLPLLGYLPFLGKNLKETYLKLSKTYGGIFSVQIGGELTVVLNTYDLVKEALTNPSSLDRKGETFAIVPELGFLTNNGREWHEQRSFCMQSMRDLGLGKGQWEKMIKDEIPSFLEELRALEGKPTDLSQLFYYAIGGNILSLLIGGRLEKGKDDGMIRLAHDFSHAVAQYFDSTNITAYFPGLLSILTKLKVAGYDQASSVMNRFTDAIRKKGIDEHKNSPEYKGVHDFINLYLQKIESKNAQGGKHYFTEDNALGTMVTLFVGGNDTIVSSLTWAIRLMAKHPDIQKKVQAELDDVIGSDGSIAYEDRLKIPFTFAVLMESQRYSTIVPVPAPRRARDDMKVGGYTIPKGGSIASNIWALHRDPKYWKYPDQFYPQHFLSEDEKKVLISQPSFLPFTIGRRNCPGETVAWMEIITFFTSVMQNFTISPIPGEEARLDVELGIIEHLKPQKLCFTQRSH